MYDEALAKSIANQVIQHVDEFGHIADGVVQRYADKVPCDPSTIYRWLRKYCGWTAPKTALNPKNVGPILHAHAGNIAATYRALDDMGVDGLQSLSSFRRFIRRNGQMIRMHAYTTKGKEGLDNVTSYVRMQVDHRNDLWQGDHTELDVFVHVSGRRKPIKPWLTTLVDCKTRLVVAHALTTGNTPNSEVICGTLARAVKPRIVTLDGRELDGGDIGGIPSALRHDRGKDWHESKRVQEVLATFGSPPAEFEAAFYAAQQADPAGVGNQ